MLRRALAAAYGAVLRREVPWWAWTGMMGPWPGRLAARRLLPPSRR